MGKHQQGEVRIPPFHPSVLMMMMAIFTRGIPHFKFAASNMHPITRYLLYYLLVASQVPLFLCLVCPLLVRICAALSICLIRPVDNVTVKSYSIHLPPRATHGSAHAKVIFNQMDLWRIEGGVMWRTHLMEIQLHLRTYSIPEYTIISGYLNPGRVLL